jgi:hypothetical protein
MKVLDVGVGQKFKVANDDRVFQKIEYEYAGCCSPDANSIVVETGVKLFISNNLEATLWTD